MVVARGDTDIEENRFQQSLMSFIKERRPPFIPQALCLYFYYEELSALGGQLECHAITASLVSSARNKRVRTIDE